MTSCPLTSILTATCSLPGWDQPPKGAGTHQEEQVGQTGEWHDRLSTVGPQTHVYKHLLTELHHAHRSQVTDGPPTQEPQVSNQGVAGPGTKQGRRHTGVRQKPSCFRGHLLEPGQRECDQEPPPTARQHGGRGQGRPPPPIPL